MVEYEIQDFHLIASKKFAILALYNLITLVAKILHSYYSVWQICNLDMSSWRQTGRAHLLVCSIKVRIPLILNLRQFVPMGIPQIAGNSIKGTGMGRTFVLGKPQKSLKRS